MKKVSLILLCIAFSYSCKVAESEDEFRSIAFAGIITELKYQGRAIYTLSIHDYSSKDTLTFHLYISKFIDENEISVGDSIQKEIGHDVFFYKKNNGEYLSEPLRLYYY